jgi:predicted dithiol-disulfide oxidoreductase (DUF899 family)
MSLATRATETEAYRARRAELLEAELELRAQRIRVAALRRELPLDTEVEDYLFEEGPADVTADEPAREVRLSALFDDPAKPLILYHFMYGGAQTRPCPMCTMWIDGFDAVAPYVMQHAGLAVVAQAPVRQLRAWAGRGAGRRSGCCRRSRRASSPISARKRRTEGSCR